MVVGHAEEEVVTLIYHYKCLNYYKTLRYGDERSKHMFVKTWSAVEKKIDVSSSFFISYPTVSEAHLDYFRFHNAQFNSITIHAQLSFSRIY